MDESIQQLPFNEDGVCVLPNKQLISNLSVRITESLYAYYNGLSANELKITGKPLRGQALSRVIRFDINHTRKNKKYTIYAKLCPKWAKLDPCRLELPFTHKYLYP